MRYLGGNSILAEDVQIFAKSLQDIQVLKLTNSQIRDEGLRIICCFLPSLIDLALGKLDLIKFEMVYVETEVGI